MNRSSLQYRTLIETSSIAMSSSSNSNNKEQQQDQQVSSNVDISCGHPIPLDEHACSVSLPKWSDVVGYEEGNVSVTSKMLLGYPRFVYHPYVVRLMEIAVRMAASGNTSSNEEEEEAWDCIVVPSYDAACRAHDYILKAVVLLPAARSNSSSGRSFASMLTSPDNALDCLNTNTKKISQDHHHHHQAAIIRIKDLCIPSNVHAVIFPAETKFAIAAKSYWQHTGEIVTSRRAEAALIELGHGIPTRVTTHSFLLDQHQSPSSSSNCTTAIDDENQAYACLHPAIIKNCNTNNDHATTLLKQRIASITNTCADTSVYLFPSGMASIYSALRSARRHRLLFQQGEGEGGTSIVFGFSYLDTVKLCGRPEICPDGVEFFGFGNSHDLETLEQMLQERSLKNNNNNNNDAGICALITEFPSNPLLNCHDLAQLRKLADQYNFILIVDDTISNFANTDLISTGIADVVCTSLTKLWNGKGDAIGGSMVINPNTPKGKWIMADMKQHYRSCDLYASDAVALYHNSADFLERSTKINETSESLADWFYNHPDVYRVYYPKFTQPHLYNRFLSNQHEQQHTPGYGGLLSILVESHVCVRTFYDSLGVYKGPSLGTNFTLACPYTLLAHYHELEFARAYNVSPNLIRIAIGMEGFDILKDRFEKAFDISRLHPKLKPAISVTNKVENTTHPTNTTTQQQRRGYCTSSSWQRQSPTIVMASNYNTKQRQMLLSICRRSIRLRTSSPAIIASVATTCGMFLFQ